MKKRLLIGISILCITLISAVSASAPAPVGDRILLNGSITEFPVGTPFHIAGEWAFIPSIDAQQRGLFDYSLDVDGVLREPTFIDRKFVNNDPVYGDLLVSSWIYNFPDGLTGTHTFTQQHYGPCQRLVDIGWYPGPCDSPVEIVGLGPNSVTITFVP